MKIKCFVVACLLALAGGSVLAHSGGTDSKGCHMDRKAGTRHCH